MRILRWSLISREKIEGSGFTILNALYCAPNKIYEYAGCNIPMIGTDVLGLKRTV